MPWETLEVGSKFRAILQPARTKDVDHMDLFAAGVAMHQHLAVARIADRQAGRTVVVRWTTGDPAATTPPAAKGCGNALSGHREPQHS